MAMPVVGKQSVNFMDIYGASKEARNKSPLKSLVDFGGTLGTSYMDLQNKLKKQKKIDDLLAKYQSGEYSYEDVQKEIAKAEASEGGTKSAMMDLDMTQALVNPDLPKPSLLGISAKVPKDVADTWSIDGGPVYEEPFGMTPITPKKDIFATPDMSKEPKEDFSGMSKEPVEEEPEFDVVSLDKNLMNTRKEFKPFDVAIDESKMKELPSIPTMEKKPTRTKVSDDIAFDRFYNELYKLDPVRAGIEKDKYEKRKEREIDEMKAGQSNKQRAMMMLNEVASDFANIDPQDQDQWTASRLRWISMAPELSPYIPEEASQDAWDRIQSQGGGAKNVAPKGQFAIQNKLEKDISQLTYLASAAKNAGKTTQADLLTEEALTKKAELDAMKGQQRGGTGISADTWIAKNKALLNPFESKITKDQIPNYSDIFAKVVEDVGEGAVSDKIKEALMKRWSDVQSGKGGAYRDTDAEMQNKANNYSAEETLLSEGEKAFRGATALIGNKIFSGAAALASKALQGDVLAEAEIARYISGNEMDQWKNKIRGFVGLTPNVKEERVKQLAQSLADNYNKLLERYNKGLEGNKYKKNFEKVGFSVREKGSGSSTSGKPKPNSNDFKTLKAYKEAYAIWEKEGGK